MDTKICSTCKIEFALSEFNWKNKAKGTVQYCCKSCQREQQNRFYRKTPEYQAKVKAESKRRKIRIKIRYLEHLKAHKCIDCGVADPIVLTHDHRDPKLKAKCVSQMVQMAASWTRIQKEIDKCDVVCFNCHAIRTAKTQKWYENWKLAPIPPMSPTDRS